MKKRKIVKSVALLLFFSILLSGCDKGKFADRTISPKSKELDWAIAGLWDFETEESIPKEKVTELNQLLAEKGKDYQIRFHVITFNEGKLSEEDGKALRKCDLITMQNQYTFTGDFKAYPTLLECVDNNMFEPLDKYLNTELGKKIKEKMLTDLTLQEGYWKEKQWMLPVELPSIIGTSLRIKKGLYEKSGWEKDSVPDFTKCDELFEKLYVANGEKPFLVFSDRKTLYEVNGIPAELPDYLVQLLNGWGSIGANNGLGVGASREAGNDLDTRNLLREPYFEEYLNAWRRYIEKGYVNTNMDVKPLVETWNSYMPMGSTALMDEGWVLPKSENYVIKLLGQPAGAWPYTGIGAGSEQKQFAFESLADMILDLEINDDIQNFTASSFPLVFSTEILEDEQEYQELAKTVPQMVKEHTFDTFTIPEIAEINKVYAEYSTEEEDDDTQKVLERHFSKDGKVTEESIHEGIQRLNEKLDAAGMEKFIEALKEEKLKSEK